ncbi:MAG: TetR/AcrR family transcriptional regulator [Eubacteriales bacterium]|nr:TetR/AcrR family transcriptional regulator [Eubacteriales bacterium]
MRRKSTTSSMMKSYIVDALLILMEEKDFQSITIDELVKKAGVNRSTYYRHFSGKEDIIFYFLDCVMREYLEKIRLQKPDLRTYLCNMFMHYLNYKKQMLVIYRAGLSMILLNVLEKYFHAQIDTSKPLIEQYKVSFYIGGIFHHLLMWFSRDMQESPEEMTEYALLVLPPQFVPYLAKVETD